MQTPGQTLMFNKITSSKTNYTLCNTRKGNISKAPINLKTASTVNPIILNGIRSSQMIGYRIISKRAKGQHKISRINQSRIPIKVVV